MSLIWQTFLIGMIILIDSDNARSEQLRKLFSIKPTSNQQAISAPSPDGKWLAVQLKNNDIYLVNAATGALGRKVVSSPPVRQMRFDSTGTFLHVLTEWSFDVISLANGSSQSITLLEGGKITGLLTDPSGHEILLVGENGVQKSNVISGEVTFTYNNQAPFIFLGILSDWSGFIALTKTQPNTQVILFNGKTTTSNTFKHKYSIYEKDKNEFRIQESQDQKTRLAVRFPSNQFTDDDAEVVSIGDVNGKLINIPLLKGDYVHVTPIQSPKMVSWDGKKLFFLSTTSFQGHPTDRRIFKMDLSVSPPTSSEYLSGTHSYLSKNGERLLMLYDGSDWATKENKLVFDLVDLKNPLSKPISIAIPKSPGVFSNLDHQELFMNEDESLLVLMSELNTGPRAINVLIDPFGRKGTPRGHKLDLPVRPSGDNSLIPWTVNFGGNGKTIYAMDVDTTVYGWSF